MTTYLFPASTAIESFRDAGYRDTSMALAELVDNSIQAEADNIRILAIEENVSVQRTVANVGSLAVYDDGHGMAPDVLEICLAFAQGTRLNTRSGIGRFGVGLPLASISQCKRVTAYSWQKGKCFTTHLDIDEVKKSGQQMTNDVKECEIPGEILRHLDVPVKEQGSLIVWEDCDRLDLRRTNTLVKRMEASFCRIYRHFLDDDNTYGRKRDIRILIVKPDADKVEIVKLLPNDPLYLMTPHNLPGFENEATNEAYGEVQKIPVKYGNKGKKSVVEVRYSIIRPEIARWTRNSDTASVVDHYKTNTGISFVRAGREIDFGSFGYFNPQELPERYWGCEIRFEPELDELFGVTNNKQAVRDIDYIEREEVEQLHEGLNEDDEDFDHKIALRGELGKNFKNARKGMMARISGLKPEKGSTVVGRKTDPATQSAELAGQNFKNDPTKTKTKVEKDTVPDEEQDAKLKDMLIQEHGNDLSDDELNRIVEEIKLTGVTIIEKAWPGNQFYTIERPGEIMTIALNAQHPFQAELYDKICKGTDTQEALAMNLFLIAAARAEDELWDDKSQEILEEFREKWGGWIKKLLTQLNNS
ncbi:MULTISPECIES: ATP-binding protein [Pacificibacter]|uniref:ATP-binding protein n=1 Tax=Pacificibacter TaxID=1042323 RepID=UPI001C08C9CC|nr:MULTISPECIES: ATP-binding protein [Pacificibacter]MBU2934524.1 ATP-binding protein [Pacificibacter marinus]MDO6617143.1 ATP-binding protein [Pacificibacter sp. 1_MG-2023]